MTDDDDGVGRRMSSDGDDGDGQDDDDDDRQTVMTMTDGLDCWLLASLTAGQLVRRRRTMGDVGRMTDDGTDGR